MPQYFEIAKAVFQKDNSFLLLKRFPHSVSYPNTWDFAGGKLDPGETPEESVIRETKEEANLDIDSGPVVKEALYEDADYKLKFYFYHPILPSGTVVLSKAHTKAIWVTEEEMKSMDLHPSVQVFLDEDNK